MLHQEEDLAQGLSDDSESDDSKLLREKWTLSSKRLFDENLVVFKCSQLSDDLSWEDKNEEWEKREATGRQVWLLFVSCSRSEIGKEEKETFLKLSSPGVTIEMFFLFFNCLQERNLSLSNPLQGTESFTFKPSSRFGEIRERNKMRWRRTTMNGWGRAKERRGYGEAGTKATGVRMRRSAHSWPLSSSSFSLSLSSSSFSLSLSCWIENPINALFPVSRQ